jgi:hypothetical protein
MAKTISRRSLLRGAGGFFLGLPFLEAMVPSLVFGQPAGVPRRFVNAFCGTIVGNDTLSNPGAFGALPATLPASWKALQSVRQHVSIISNLTIPTYNSGTTPTAPASAYNMQHGTTPAPMFAGVTSRETMAVMVNGQTADQYAAEALGAGSKLGSLQVRTQLLSYTGSSNNRNGIMSARVSGGQLLSLPPVASPVALYNLLFAGGVPTGPSPLDRQASVLDLIKSDASRLTSAVGAADKTRLDQHFTEVRALEQSILATLGGGGGGCGPATVPVDPPAGANQLGGWSNETVRGALIAEMLGYALGCDLTRVASWMLSFEQVQMANIVDQATTMHDDSHNAGSRDAVIAANCNWHAELFARLVAKLAAMPEAGATVLDSTFLSLNYAEAKNAHGRSGMRHVVAGIPARIKNGFHIDGGGLHPGKLQISGLQAVGVNTNTLGELTGSLAAVLV